MAPVSRASSLRETVFSSRFLCCSFFFSPCLLLLLFALGCSAFAAGAAGFASGFFSAALGSAFFSAGFSAFFSAFFSGWAGCFALFRYSSRLATLLSLLNFSSR